MKNVTQVMLSFLFIGFEKERKKVFLSYFFDFQTGGKWLSKVLLDPLYPR